MYPDGSVEKSDRLITIYSMRNNVDQSATSTMISGWNDKAHIDVTGTRCHCEVRNQCTIALHDADGIVWFRSAGCCYAAMSIL